MKCKKSLKETNSYLKDPIKRKKLLTQCKIAEAQRESWERTRDKIAARTFTRAFSKNEKKGA